MKVCILGLGYVGVTTAACLAHLGHEIIGVDIDRKKVDIINSGMSPVVEPGLNEMIADAVRKSRLKAIDRIDEALLDADLVFVCVGTPSGEDGEISLVYLKRVFVEIGKCLQTMPEGEYLSIVLRSTVLPGIVNGELVPLVQKQSGKSVGTNWGLAQNPEFLREGSAIADFLGPPVTVVGALDSVTESRLKGLYKDLNAPLVSMSIDEAAMVKYANNAFHALKITFANEIGKYSKSLGINARNIMETVCLDSKLNISTAYLKPGFAFGGSCLPKDLKALIHDGSERNIELPVLKNTIASNDSVIESVVDRVMIRTPKRVLIVGICFKENTDDLRESPMVYLAARLLEAGLVVRFYDPLLKIEFLSGANKLFGEMLLEDIEKLQEESLGAGWGKSDCIVLANHYPEIQKQLGSISEDKYVLDLNGIAIDNNGGDDYDGLWW